MERPRDDYKLTHNVRLATRDSLFGGQVSRLQVAELVAACVGNDDVAANKVWARWVGVASVHVRVCTAGNQTMRLVPCGLPVRCSLKPPQRCGWGASLLFGK